MNKLFEYVERETKKTELYNLLVENKLTPKEIAGYIDDLKLTEEEIQQIDEAIGAALSKFGNAVGRGASAFGRGALKVGTGLARVGGRALGTGIKGATQVGKGFVSGVGQGLGIQPGTVKGALGKIGQAVKGAFAQPGAAAQQGTAQPAAAQQQQSQLIQNNLSQLVQMFAGNQNAIALINKLYADLQKV